MPARKKSQSSTETKSRSSRSSGTSTSRAAPEITIERLYSAFKSAAEKPQAGLLPALAAHDIVPPIVLIETGGFRSRKVIDWAKGSIFHHRPDSIVTAFGPELTNTAAVDAVCSALTSYSLLTPVQLVAIIDADKIKTAHAAKIATALERGKSISLSILSVADGEKPPILKEIGGSGIRVPIGELNGQALARWIGVEAGRMLPGQQAGAITGEAADQLSRLFAGDLAGVTKELEKLALLTDRGQPIDLPLVRRTTIRETEHNSFELFQRILKRDAPGTVHLVDLLINQGFHPLQISSFLSKAVRTAIAAKEKTGPGEKLHNDVGNAWFARNLGATLSAVRIETLRHFLTLIKKLDSDLKGSKLPPELVTSVTATRMAGR